MENIRNSLSSLLSFKDDDEKIQFEVEVLHLDIMAIVRICMFECNMKKKLLAKELGVSKNYLNKLFRGDKLINLKLLVQFQRIFNVKFEFSIMENK